MNGKNCMMILFCCLHIHNYLTHYSSWQLNGIQKYIFVDKLMRFESRDHKEFNLLSKVDLVVFSFLFERYTSQLCHGGSCLLSRTFSMEGYFYILSIQSTHFFTQLEIATRSKRQNIPINSLLPITLLISR